MVLPISLWLRDLGLCHGGPNSFDEEIPALTAYQKGELPTS